MLLLQLLMMFLRVKERVGQGGTGKAVGYQLAVVAEPRDIRFSPEDQAVGGVHIRLGRPFVVGGHSRSV